MRYSKKSVSFNASQTIQGRTTFVLYLVPNIKELLPDYYLYDMHIHTRASDGYATSRQVSEWAARHHIGIAITDHNQISGSIKAYNLNLCPVIPGIEIATKQGLDILAYFEEPETLERFYKECIERHKGINPHSFTRLDVYDALKLGKDYGAFTVLPHPFSYGWKNWTDELVSNEKKIVKLVDGIECCNASLPAYLNRDAYALAARLNKTYVGGSDSHNLASVASVLTLVPHGFQGTLFDALREQKTSVIGYKTPLFRSLSGLSIMSFNHMKWWPRVAKNKIKGAFRER